LVPWLWAFGFTQVVEMPLYVLGLTRSARRRGTDLAEGAARRWLIRALVAFGASAITHPIVWFVMPRLFYSAPVMSTVAFDTIYPLMVAVAESFAIAVEAIYLHAFGVKRAWAWALGANLASVTLGLASRALFGWP
jgi:hypothetical protein